MSSFLNRLGFYTDKDVRQVISNADSRGASFNWQSSTNYDPKNLGLVGDRPEFDYPQVDEVLDNDPVVRAAVISLVDKVLEGGYVFKAEHGKSGVETLRETMQETKYYNHLRQLVANLIIYNNAYEEIVRGGDGKVRHVNVLEFSFTEPVTAKNGDVKKYKQDVETSDEESYIEWEPKDVVHYRLDRFTTTTTPSSNFEALYETVLVKDFVRQWLMYFHKTNQQRPVISVNISSNSAMEKFLSTLKSMSERIDAPIPVKGEFDVGPLQNFGELSQGIFELLDWCDEQILMLLNVPPIVVGKPNESGRSDAAEQRQNLYTRVNAIQEVVAEHVNEELLPKAGYDAVRFAWGSMDTAATKDVFENVRLMRQSQFTDEAIKEYLSSQGVHFETSDVLVSQREVMQMSNEELGTGNEDMAGRQSKDSMMSRERQSEDTIQDGNRTVQES